MTNHDLPAHMTAIAITGPGGPEVLQPERHPLPNVRDGEILIRVEAAGVNRPDVLQRMGRYTPPPDASPLPGLEVAGTVSMLGPGVQGLQIGDSVCALSNGGGYAEFVAVPVGQVLALPSGLTMTQGAGLPETFFTVWTNVFERGGLRRGETILIHGGSSGIGTTAIQLAKAFGATVLTTAGSEEKCAACRELGADVAINYREEDYVEVAKAQTQGRGVDLVLDMVGGDYLPRNIDVLAEEGRHISIAFLAGGKITLNMQKVMVKCLTLTGSTLRPRTTAQKARIADGLREMVWPLIEAGRVRPVIHSTFPLEEAAAAHALMERSAHIGKIILLSSFARNV